MFLLITESIRYYNENNNDNDNALFSISTRVLIFTLVNSRYFTSESEIQR